MQMFEALRTYVKSLLLEQSQNEVELRQLLETWISRYGQEFISEINAALNQLSGSDINAQQAWHNVLLHSGQWYGAIESLYITKLTIRANVSAPEEDFEPYILHISPDDNKVLFTVTDDCQIGNFLRVQTALKYNGITIDQFRKVMDVAHTYKQFKVLFEKLEK
jgi:hypothetical protein